MIHKGFYEFGPFRLDVSARVLFRDGKIVPLTPKVLDTLVVLVENAGDLVAKEKLLTAVWSDTAVEEGNLTHNISVLRKTLRIGSDETPYIETVPKRGYRFAATVSICNGHMPGSKAAESQASSRGPWMWVVPAAGILAAAALASLFWPRPVRVSPSEFQQLTNFSDSAVAPALSPDGKMLTFIRSERSFLSPGQIYVKTLPNGDSTQLTDDPRPKFSPQFSPDGSRVVFSRTEPSKSAWDTWSVPVVRGVPTFMLPNATGLAWIAEHQVLFSEVKKGLHMGIVTANEDRSAKREIYFPAHERAMAHYSYVSPDRKWVLLVEMDRTAAWEPCRLVPFDGSSAGRKAGPSGACTSAGWSPDGRWMYFSVFIRGVSHLWRQRFPDGSPEQITFGPTEEEGVAVPADGRSIITSVGMRQSAVWMRDKNGERPVLKEGFASNPVISADGRRLYSLLRENSTSSLRELTVTDLDSSKTERVLPGVSMDDYDVSSRETEVVYSAKGPSGSAEFWIAPLNRRSSPLRIPLSGDASSGEASPSFGPDNDVLFVATEENRNFVYRMNRDGSARRKLLTHAVNNLQSVSPDGRWLIAFAPIGACGAETGTFAVSVDDGKQLCVCPGFCRARWGPDGRSFYVTFGEGKTLAIPLAEGTSLPAFPGTGIKSAEVSLFRGSVVLDQGTGTVMAPGLDLLSYAYVKRTTHRNLFRIPLR